MDVHNAEDTANLDVLYMYKGITEWSFTVLSITQKFWTYIGNE